jgi:flagellar basal-body rod modification protein FlgD
MVDSVTGPGTTTAQALSSALGGTDSKMGRDDFLKLLVAQLKNQDPLKPQDNSEFVAQLAQFSSLEQAMTMNTKLDLLATQNQGLANTQITNLVGKLATVKGTLVTSNGGGVGVQVSFTLSDPSASTQVVIADQTGRVVRTMNIGPRGAGFVTTQWDGRDDAGLVQPAGVYAVSVQAKNDVGGSVSVLQETTGVVESVGFDKGFPELTLDNGLQVPVSDLLRVDSPASNPSTNNGSS